MAFAVLPRAFVWRRLHSLTGLWLVLFLMEHLLVNSQAALLLGDKGKIFVDMVNSIHNFPFLHAIEIFLLGMPILVHMIWGVQYLFTCKFNSHQTDGSKPALPEYSRNRAYTWQRISSWILLFLLTAHVVKDRFVDYPLQAGGGDNPYYFSRVSLDNGIYAVADRLGVELYDEAGVSEQRVDFDVQGKNTALVEEAERIRKESGTTPVYDVQKAYTTVEAQKYLHDVSWIEAMEKMPLKEGEVIAVSKDFGTATLMYLRDTFKNPIYVALYTIFVLAACFHAFNGFWTFLITWGVIFKYAAQKSMVKFSYGLMLLVTFLGLMAIWGTYYLNLRH